jgi:hypothetical protein
VKKRRWPPTAATWLRSRPPLDMRKDDIMPVPGIVRGTIRVVTYIPTLVAIHEAGHAVAAILVGHTVRYASLLSRRYDGVVQLTAAGCWADDFVLGRRKPRPLPRAKHIAAHRLEIMSCAGYAAEREAIARGYPYVELDPPQWRKRAADRRAAETYATLRGARNPERAARRSIEAARQLLRANWLAVEGVAHALATRYRLTGAEIRRIARMRVRLASPEAEQLLRKVAS